LIRVTNAEGASFIQPRSRLTAPEIESLHMLLTNLHKLYAELTPNETATSTGSERKIWGWSLRAFHR